MTTTHCKATTTSGKKCQAKPKAGSNYCFIHDPSQAQARAKARKKGGETHRTPHASNASTIPGEIDTLQDAKSILSYTLAEILVHENTIARARVLLSLFDSFAKSIEIGELEQRIAALEAMK